MLATFFDRIVIISLRERLDRRARLTAHLAQIGWPFPEPVWFPAISPKLIPVPEGWQAGGGAWGCSQSHRLALADAIRDGLDSLLVLEDDVYFVEDFASRVAEFLAAVPPDWEQLMLGGQFHARGLHGKGMKPVNGRVLQVWGAERTHAYAVRGQYLRELYAKWSFAHGHCDHVMGPFQHGRRVYAPAEAGALRWLAGQAGGKSDITGREKHPERWESPPGERPVFLFRDRGRFEMVRGHTHHGGYWRDEATGIDVGLAKIAALPAEEQPAKLRTWLRMIDAEAWSRTPACCAAIYCPALADEVIREVCGLRLTIIAGAAPALPPGATERHYRYGVKGGEAPADRAVWGPQKWEHLHRQSLALETPAKRREFLAAFARSLPCGECKKHWQAVCAKLPPRVQTAAEFFEWTVDAHNAVNRQLHKLVWTLAQARQRWGLAA